MSTYEITIVDYSDKAIAVVMEYETIYQYEFKLLGGRFNSRLKFGAGWIFSREKSESGLMSLFAYDGLTEFINRVNLADMPGVATSGDKPHKTKTGAAALPDYILSDEQRKEWARQTFGDPDYYIKNYNIVVRLTNGEIVPIEKNSLKTEFWFGESDFGQGPTCEEAQQSAHYARTNEDYFLNENLEDLKNVISRLDGTYEKSHKYLWLANYNRDNTNQWWLDTSSVCPEATNAIEHLDCRERELYNRGYYRKLSEADKQRLITGYNLALQAMEKRCRAYLKRYGLSKITARTYWMDR